MDSVSYGDEHQDLEVDQPKLMIMGSENIEFILEYIKLYGDAEQRLSFYLFLFFLLDKYLHDSFDRKKPGGRKQEDIVLAIIENFSSLVGESRRMFEDDAEDEGHFVARNHFLTTNQQKGFASRTVVSLCPCNKPFGIFYSICVLVLINIIKAVGTMIFIPNHKRDHLRR
jgi:hypothetical protein